jgi:hypothetical protein
LWAAAAIVGERAAGHRGEVGLRAHRPPDGSGGLQGLVAEFAQDVVAALEQFACECEAGAVAAESFGGLVVVGAVGVAGPACGLRGLIERPTQRGRPLAREVPGRAAPIGLMDGDVQSGVADGLAR